MSRFRKKPRSCGTGHPLRSAAAANSDASRRLLSWAVLSALQFGYMPFSARRMAAVPLISVTRVCRDMRLAMLRAGIEPAGFALA